MHYHWRGVPKDNVKAYAWCSLAAGGGHAAGKLFLSLIESNMKPSQIKQAQREAAGLHSKIKKS